MNPPRPVTDPDRMIRDFTVYDLGEDGWRAVHTRDSELTAEYDDWERLVYRCSIMRLAYEIRMARSGTEAGS